MMKSNTQQALSEAVWQCVAEETAKLDIAFPNAGSLASFHERRKWIRRRQSQIAPFTSRRTALSHKAKNSFYVTAYSAAITVLFSMISSQALATAGSGSAPTIESWVSVAMLITITLTMAFGVKTFRHCFEPVMLKSDNHCADDFLANPQVPQAYRKRLVWKPAFSRKSLLLGLTGLRLPSIEKQPLPIVDADIRLTALKVIYARETRSARLRGLLD